MWSTAYCYGWAASIVLRLAPHSLRLRPCALHTYLHSVWLHAATVTANKTNSQLFTYLINILSLAAFPSLFFVPLVLCKFSLLLGIFITLCFHTYYNTIFAAFCVCVWWEIRRSYVSTSICEIALVYGGALQWLCSVISALCTLVEHGDK